MAKGDCADCGGFDIEWMHFCPEHKGVEFCRGCECPFCADEHGEDNDDYFDGDGYRAD